MIKPLAIDLCCGRGGWAHGLIAAGFRVIGFDLDASFVSVYPGEFYGNCDVRVLARDVEERHLSGWYGRLCGAALIVASPPCEEFTRHMMPWTRRRNPPPPDLSIVYACHQIQKTLGVPMILENVREAQNWIGVADRHFGPFYLWGDVPVLLPPFSWTHYRQKQSRSSTARVERAIVPMELAQHIGRIFHP